MAKRKKNKQTKTVQGNFVKVADKRVSALSPAVYSFVASAIHSAGFDINNDYMIESSKLISDVVPANENRYKIQKHTLPILDETANELLTARKYIYAKTEMFDTSHHPSGSREKKTSKFYMVAKTEKGFVPFYLLLESFITPLDGKNNYGVDTTFNAILKGKNYITLKRYNGYPKNEHKNTYYTVNGQFIRRDSSTADTKAKLNKRGIPHHHTYFFKSIEANILRGITGAEQNLKLDALESKAFDKIEDLMKFLWNEYNISDVDYRKCEINFETDNFETIYQKLAESEQEQSQTSSENQINPSLINNMQNSEQ